MRGLKNVRLANYDYRTDGYYFVTIVTNYRKKYFRDKKQPIEEELNDLVVKTNGLSVDYFVIMPDHIHLIFVLENCNISLGEIVRRFKAKVSHKLSANIWQPSYYEHVIRSDKAFKKIREYIINNPQAEVLKFEQFYN